MNIEIRWLIKRDIPEVLAIESLSFPDPLPEQELIKCLRTRNTIGMVVEECDRVIGFMVYELHQTRVPSMSIRLAVHPNHRRRGIGSMMIEKLRSKMSCDLRNKLVSDVRESNLGGQLFFKYLGFRAVRVLRDHFSDGQDAYQMVYRIGAAKAPQNISVKEAGR